MKFTNRHLRGLRYFAPVFCSIAVLSTQLQAGPTVQLNGDESRDGMADSGSLGYVGGNTRIGVSIDRELQGQVDINQIIMEDDSSATSAEGWFGYKIKDDETATKGIQGGGVKLNHQWVNDDADAVHKVFGAYDRNTDAQAKATLGYGQETEDLFWSGHVSKGMGDDIVNGDITRRAYDYGVGGEVGTFIDSTLTRVRGGLDYEFGTQQADDEDRPGRLTVSAGVEQFFHDTPHSISLDVSGYQKSGGNDAEDTDFNARLGYNYEFGGDGVYQSDQTTRRRRVEIPGAPGSPGRAGVPGIPATPAIAATPARPGRAAIPAKYERQAVQTPGHEFVKTTMKLENETFFKLNSSVLTDSAKRNLDKIVSQIRGHGYLGMVRITGNTCGMGDPIYDQRLSENRANAVRDYLLAQGFNPEHLVARGLGKGSPKYDRKDDDFKNRRVDLEYVTERSIKKQTKNNVQYKNVLIQEGRPAIPAQPARPGRAGHPGRPAIPEIAATPGTPSRFVWKTEVVKSAPIWIKRALHNTIRHNKTISTYTTRSSQKAVDDNYTLTDKSGLINVLGNDSDGVTLASWTQPLHGSVTREGDQLRYIPNPGFSGSDSFTYTVVDRDGNEITATVNIQVPTVVNNAPTAVSDTETTNENTEVTIRVLDNDTDRDNGDTLTITGTTTPANGSVSVVGDHIVYTPNTNFSGTDTFDYTITDTSGNTSTATVTVTVSNVNEPPKATDDNVTTSENTAITIDAIDNDNDPDGDALVITTVGNPSHGSVAIVNNEIFYTPVNGYSGSDSFTYTITDGQGHNVTANISVTVEAASSNAAPVATNDARTTNVDTAITIPVMSNDSDPDGDSIALTGMTDPANGSVNRVGADIVYTPNAGFTGTDTFDYTITDSNGSTATATVTVTVEAVSSNAAPVATDDSRSTNEDTPVTIAVMSNDSDPDGDTINITSTTSPLNGVAVISGTDIIYTPNTGFSGTDIFDYTITDNQGHEVSASVIVTVSKSNNAPTAYNDSRTTVQNTPLAIDVMSNDGDPDNGDYIVIDSVGAPGNGTTSISGVNIIYTPTAGYTGTDSFVYTITDQHGLTANATVDVVINSANQAPKLTNDTVATLQETLIAIDVTLNDTDPDGDTLTVTQTTNPSNGTVSISSNNVNYTPASGYTGPDSFTYTVDDGNGHTETATVNITVNPANQPPVAVNDSASTTYETEVIIPVASNDTDPDGTTTCISNIVSNPANGYVSILTTGTDISYTPNDGFSGTDSFVYTACDADGATSTATVTVTVTANSNQAPVLSPNYAAIQGYSSVPIRVLEDDTDPEGDTLTILRTENGPSNGTVTISGSLIYYEANAGFVGADSFYYVVSDGNGNEGSARVDIDVKNDNNAPVVAAIPAFNASTGTTTPMDISSYLSDADGDNVYIAVADALGGSLTFSGTTLQYTPVDASAGDTDTIYITVSDGNGGTDDGIITVNIQ